MLTRLLSLPKSARNKVAEIAAFDLVRKTPFKPTDVYSAVWLETSSGDELSVTQHVAKRSEIDAILRRLESVGLRVRKICIENRASSPLVDRTELVAPYAKVWRRLNIALVGLGGLLATALWTIPGWHAQNAIAKLEPALLERRTDVVAMRQRFEQKNASATQTERFLQAVTQRARMVEILRALTVTLPDEVWLSDVVLRQGQLVISGETSGSATDLVLNLAKTPIFIGPRLSGPVSRTSNGGERFQIAMTVEVQ
ncbi:PilN domain-containing protein [Aliiroseovarius halocynthiae]|nr:PilN domain-containing protein [Aliiroseovarius halocynthiae]